MLDLKHWKEDLPAGIVVFLVALPLCMGIALASGAPLISGLIAGMIGGVVVGFFSGSHLSVSGPAAGLYVIVLGAITELGFDVFLTAVVLAGAMQLAFGVAKAGFISHYFPASVIRGMLAAIGLLLIFKQIPHLIGVDSDAFGEMKFQQADGHNTFDFLFYAFQNPHWGAVVIGGVIIVQLWLWETRFIKQNRFLKGVPGALVAVLLGVGLNEWFAIAWREGYLEGIHMVQLPNIPEEGGWLNVLRYPDLSGLTQLATYKVALTIAIVASLETLLSLEAVDKLDVLKRQSPRDQELRAQGIGNMVSGLIGGLPMTAVIVRSSANIAAGGRTKLSAIFHGLLLITAVSFFPKLLMHIPVTSLSAILIIVGFKLTKPALFASQWKLGVNQFYPFVITILAIVLTDLLVGIGIGLIAGIFFVLRAQNKQSFELQKNPRSDEEEGLEITIQLNKHVSFLNKAELLEILESAPNNSKITIDGTVNESMDHDVEEVINSFADRAEDKKIELELTGMNA